MTLQLFGIARLDERIDCPVILAQGTPGRDRRRSDPAVPRGHPRSRFVPLIGAGHAPQSDSPDAILHLVCLAAGEASAAPPAA